jgi:TIR domain
LTIWDDKQIQIGGNWDGDINTALNQCNVFVLLVSNDSLASHYINETEVKRIRERRQTENVPFCPIVVTPCLMETVDWLMELDLRPKDDKALSELPKARRDRETKTIVKEIVGIVQGIAAGKQAKQIEQASAHRASSTSMFDYGRLPDTPYKKLVGRNVELETLNQAWTGNKINIICLIAWGGVGKTSLINDWINQLHKENYRDAAGVLGWSFYNEGTKERATSADEFLNWALEKLGKTATSTSAVAKGEVLAEAMAAKPVLLVLDGVEPLQHGPGEQEGQLKDQGLRAFLRRFAATPPASAEGLVVLTSRLPTRDIERWVGDDGPVLMKELLRLSSDAGVALLRDNGVRGADRLLKAAVEDFEGHALALSLLASFLARRHAGDIQRKDRVGPLLQTADARGHGHARRVMQTYENEWLKDEPVLSAIVHVVGLFDRPASGDCLEALCRKPAIEGLTERLVGLSPDEWADAISELREVRVLDPVDPRALSALDAHPLVREWFGEQLKATNEKAWRAAHGRLYEHLRDTTKEGKTPTLEDLAPLYQAIAHGCRAGRHQEVLKKIYIDRICRRLPDGDIEFYSWKKLGAFGSDLAAISWFFDKPYETPVATLTEAVRPWVLGEAARSLRAQGRFAEVLPAERAGLRMHELADDWKNAAIGAVNLSEAELVVGDVAAAVASAALSVEYADRSGDEFVMLYNRTTHADALHAAGRRDEAEALFADAERRQRDYQPDYPLLYSIQGYWYCDLWLAKGDWAAASERATQTLEWGKQEYPLLDFALDILTLGRAHLGLALAAWPQSTERREDARTARSRLDEAVDGLRAAGRNEFIPRGLLARAAFRRSVGDWGGAARDLDEVEEIAEPGPMRLHLCDMALERARLAFARIEAFAPLNGVLETDSPEKPAVPSADEIAALRQEAAKQLAIAADYIEKCGYHRRDEELAELQAVLKGEKQFAALPPRV